MKKKLLAFTFIIITAELSAQTTFNKTFLYPNQIDPGNAILTNDGGYIITASGPGAQQYVVKTNSFGDTLWTKNFSSLWGNANVIQTNDGGYMFTSANGIIKTNSAGSISWSKGSFGPLVIRQTSDGGYIYTGGLLSRYLGKLNSSGNCTFNKYYNIYWENGGGQGSTEDVKQTSDGGYIIAGYTYMYGAGGADYCLTKTDASGNFIWSKTYGGTSHDLAMCVVQNPDGGYIISGYTESFGAGLWDVYVVRTDASGNLIWSKTYGGNNYDYNSTIQRTVDGGYIISGPSLSFGSGPSNKVCLIKTDSAGTVVWSNAYTYSASDHYASAEQTPDGGYIVGASASGCCPGGIILIKTDASGNSWCFQYPAAVITGVPPTQVSSAVDTVYDMTDTMSTMSVTVTSGASVSTCIPTGIQSNIIGTQTAISFSPNPAFDELIIDNGELKIEAVEIYNTLGEKVYEKRLTSDVGRPTISVADLLPGVYFVAVTDDKGNKITKRFVKM